MIDPFTKKDKERFNNVYDDIKEKIMSATTTTKVVKQKAK